MSFILNLQLTIAHKAMQHVSHHLHAAFTKWRTSHLFPFRDDILVCFNKSQLSCCAGAPDHHRITARCWWKAQELNWPFVVQDMQFRKTRGFEVVEISTPCIQDDSTSEVSEKPDMQFAWTHNSKHTPARCLALESLLRMTGWTMTGGVLVGDNLMDETWWDWFERWASLKS